MANEIILEHSRRDFIKYSAFLYLQSTSPIRIGNKVREFFHDLYEQDSFIGNDGLPGAFQEQYYLGHKAKLKTRSSPNTAQLPIEMIIDTLGLSKNNSLDMLYPGAGDDLSTLLFAYLLRKKSQEQFPINIICTDIKREAIESFEKQLIFLKDRGILKYDLEDTPKNETTEFKFTLEPSNMDKFNIIYKLGPENGIFFADNDARKSNFFKDILSHGHSAYPFVAEMIKKGVQDRPTMVNILDYDRLGRFYNELMTRDNISNQPIKFISDKDLIAFENKKGPLLVGYNEKDKKYIYTDTNRDSNETPIKDIPGKVNFSRGFIACNCPGCFKKMEKGEREKYRRYYSVLFSFEPEDLRCVSKEELQKKIERAFRGCFFDIKPTMLHP